MISIRKPIYFTEKGRKDNQEDALWPLEATTATRAFILCDGMGGHDNGEVASQTAAAALGEFLSSKSEVDVDTFELALSKAYDALDDIDTNSPKKPGTTMTCLCLNENSYLVAHIGDSRIYHIRPTLFNAQIGRGGIIYQSSDHSLVNDLLKAGELTEEEARNFPQKNVITRAMQPHLPKRYKADVYEFDDIESGDYFFLCCDGVLEQLSNEDLCRILADRNMSDEQKLAEIKAICDDRTRDNYTCWLIPIDKVCIKSRSKVSNTIQAEIEVEEEQKPQLELTAKRKTHFQKLTKRTIILGVLIFVALIVCGVLVCNLTVSYAAKGRLYDSVEDVPRRKVGLLLGTSPISTWNGHRNYSFDYRIKAAAELYKAGRIDSLVVSGGDYRKTEENGFDEPVAMRDSLVKQGVDSSHIILDYDGTRTLNSIAKIRDFYHQDSIIIISQRYHNERALYQAKNLGIDAIGYNARTPEQGPSWWRNQGREILARVKLFIDIAS